MMKKKRKIKPCCQDMANRVPVPSDRSDLIIEECSKCGCRHRRLVLDPGVFGVIGQDLGG